MKNLRRTLATVTLIFALVAPALAGDIHAGSPEPPASANATTQTVTTTAASTADAQSSTTDSGLAAAAVSAALSVVQALVSLF